LGLFRVSLCESKSSLSKKIWGCSGSECSAPNLPIESLSKKKLKGKGSKGLLKKKLFSRKIEMQNEIKIPTVFSFFFKNKLF
jgi:hypothetical protein